MSKNWKLLKNQKNRKPAGSTGKSRTGTVKSINAWLGWKPKLHHFAQPKLPRFGTMKPKTRAV